MNELEVLFIGIAESIKAKLQDYSITIQAKNFPEKIEEIPVSKTYNGEWEVIE